MNEVDHLAASMRCQIFLMTSLNISSGGLNAVIKRILRDVATGLERNGAYEPKSGTTWQLALSWPANGRG